MHESPVFKADLLNRFTILLSGTKVTEVQIVICLQCLLYMKRLN